MSSSSKGGMVGRIVECYYGTETDRRRQRWFTSLAVLWAVMYVGGKWLLKSEASVSPLAQWLAIVLPSGVAIAAAVVFLRFLQGADELIRKIELEGLAIGFGTGVVVGLGYPLFEFAGLPALETQTLVALMLFGWVGGHLLAWRRYLL